jgi:hypothetical protein
MALLSLSLSPGFIFQQRSHGSYIYIKPTARLQGKMISTLAAASDLTFRTVL